MSALSTSMIAASSSASTAAAKADPRDATADTSPFAILLAATLQDTPTTPQPQIGTPPAATDGGTPAANTVDTELASTQAPPPALPADNSGTVTQSGDKRDKKADAGKNRDADPSASDQALQTAQNMALQASTQAVVPPVVQSGPQSPASNHNDNSDDITDLASAISSAAAASARNAFNPTSPAQPGSSNSAAAKSAGNKTAAPQTPSQPATPQNDDAEPAMPSPVAAQISIAPDDSDTDTGIDIAQAASSQFAVNTKTDVAVTQTATSAPSAGQPVDMATAKAPATNRSIASQPAIAPPVTDKAAAQQASSQVATDDDAEPDPQNATGPAPTPAAPAQTVQIAMNAATDGAEDDDTSIDAAQASAQAPDVRTSPQASKPADKQTGRPVQPASNVSSQSPATATMTPQSATAVSDIGGKASDTDKDFAQTLASNSSDSKSAHAAATDATPQPVLPTPPIHTATTANTAPQGVTVADVSGANQPIGVGNRAPTASVHLANASADPTPDTNALAVSVAARSLSGAKEFDIRLDPAELGHVEVRLSIDASGKTQAHMTADQPQTLALLQKDAPNLTQALRDAGLDVSQGGLNFSLRGQDRQSGDKNNGTGQGRRTNLTATRAIGAAQGPMPVSYNGAAADARVDIHV